MISDVAVIGGGIAGAAACLRLAQENVRPLWICRDRPDGDKPGESLSPAARPLLQSLGCSDLLEEARHRPGHSLFSAWSSERLTERSSIVHLEGAGTVIDRPGFEQQLFQRVLEHGVHLVEGTLAEARPDEDGWELTVDDTLHRTGFVIDASGRAAVMARNQAQRFRADQLCALYAFLSQAPGSQVEPTRATLIEAASGGWWYAALLADGRLTLNYYTDSDLLPAGATAEPDLFARLLAETQYVNRWVEEAGFLLEQSPALASAATTWIAPAAGDNWAAAGDAAAAFDPLSSHGMTTALWTGIEAANCFLAEAGPGRSKASAAYAARVADGMQSFLTTRAGIYGQVSEKHAGRQFWRRRTSLQHPQL